MEDITREKEYAAKLSALKQYLNDHPEAYMFNSSRPEANMVTASQTLGATPAAEYSWRVS
jgi:hypothetical protein